MRLFIGERSSILRQCCFVSSQLSFVGCELCLLVCKGRSIIGCCRGFLRLLLQRRELAHPCLFLGDAGLLIADALCLVVQTCLFVADARLFVIDACLLIRNALLLVDDALQLIGVGGQGELDFGGCLALEVEHHLHGRVVLVDDDCRLIDDLILDGGREVGHGEVVANLELQVADGQVVFVKLHSDSGGVTIHRGAVGVGGAVVAHEVCLRGCAGPELDAKGRGPACI